MKVSNPNSKRLISSDRSYSAAVFGVVFCAVMLSIPYWATAKLSADTLMSVRLTAYAAVFLAMWMATSTRLDLDANDQKVRWRRRFDVLPFLPFFNRTLEAPLSSAVKVKLSRTRSNRKDLADLTLLLSDGREFRITHASTSSTQAEDIRARIQSWIEKHT